jgi:hypothetical protein
LAVGVTSIGGPKRVFEKFGRMIGDREQDYINTDDDRTDEIEVVSESEAYEKIEEEIGFLPVKLFYLPDGIQFDEIIITDGAQNIYLNYVGDNEESIVYFVYPNYRTGSIGRDVEDKLINEYEKNVSDITIGIEEYFVEENQEKRYIAQFEYQNVYYVLRMNNVEEAEVGKIIENLYFN